MLAGVQRNAAWCSVGKRVALPQLRRRIQYFGMDTMAASPADQALTEQRTLHALSVPNTVVLRLAGLMAGGSLVAASAALLSGAGGFPHPWHQAMAALVTLLLGLILVASVVLIPAERRHGGLPFFGGCALLVIALPLVRYIPPIYNTAYRQDLESISPPLWPYSLTIPLLFALVGELVLWFRRRTAPLLLLVASLVPASMLLFFGSQVIAALSTSVVFMARPERTLLALTIWVGASGLIVLGTAAATRGLLWIGVVTLLGTGLFLEIGSTYFYGGISQDWTTNLILNPFSPWIPFLGGTVPGALTLMMSVVVLRANSPGREPTDS